MIWSNTKPKSLRVWWLRCKPPLKRQDARSSAEWNIYASKPSRPSTASRATALGRRMAGRKTRLRRKTPTAALLAKTAEGVDACLGGRLTVGLLLAVRGIAAKHSVSG